MATYSLITIGQHEGASGNAQTVISDAAPMPVAAINGQVGVAGGSGAVSALTQRVCLATDVGLPAGSAHLGEVTANSPLAIPVSVTLTVGATYASGDHVGTSATPISFANAARVSGGEGIIHSLTISDPAASAAVALELWLFNATVTPPADSAAWDLSDADGLKCVGIISIPTTAQFLSSATGVMSVNNINLKYNCAATTLFGCLVTRGAPTYTGTLQITLQVARF